MYADRGRLTCSIRIPGSQSRPFADYYAWKAFLDEDHNLFVFAQSIYWL